MLPSVKRARHFLSWLYQSFKHRIGAMLGGFILVQSLWLLLMAPTSLWVSNRLLRYYDDNRAAAVANQDLLSFFLSPLGYLLATWLLGMTLFAAFSQHAVFTVLLAQHEVRRRSVSQALHMVLARAWLICRLALLQSALLIGVAQCLLFVARWLFGLLLADWDINYYLAQRQGRIWLYFTLLTLVSLPLAIWLLRRWLSWWLALPLCLLESGSLRQKLVVARVLSRGYLRQIFMLNVFWLLVRAVVFAAVIASFLWLGGHLLAWLSPKQTHFASLAFLLLLMVSVAYGLSFLSSWLYASFQYYAFTLLRRRFKWRTRLHQAQVEKIRRVPAPLRLLVVLALAMATWRGIDSNTERLEALLSFREVQVMAHRGGGWLAAENTLDGVEQAIALQLPSSEIDVQLSADGEVVVFHDRDLRRVAGSALVVQESSAAQLQAALAEVGPHSRVLLGEWLRQINGRIVLNIELKRYNDDLGVVDALLQLLQTYPHPVVISSLDITLLRHLKQRLPAYALPLEPKLALIEAASVGRRIAEGRYDMLMINRAWLSPWRLLKAQQAEQDVYVWTINQPDDVERFYYLGVDGLITDDPEGVREALQAIYQRSQLEHVLSGIRYWLSF